MSNAIDDKELDEYLSGGTQYSQRYRSIPTDDVPVELDQLVLMHASAVNVTPIAAAVEKRAPARAKSLAFWTRISAPIALAASVVLVVSIVIDSGVRYDSGPAESQELKRVIAPSQTPLEQAPASPEPIEAREFDSVDSPVAAVTEQSRARADAAATQSNQAKAQAKLKTAAASKLESAAKPARVATADEVSAASNLQAAAPGAIAAPPPAPAERQIADAATDKRFEAQRSSGATGLEEVIVTGSLRRGQTANSGAGPRGTIPPANFEARELSDAELAKQYREATPTAWLAYIRELRTTGKATAADREWKRFVKTHPDYSVDLEDRARPKK